MMTSLAIPQHMRTSLAIPQPRHGPRRGQPAVSYVQPSGLGNHSQASLPHRLEVKVPRKPLIGSDGPRVHFSTSRRDQGWAGVFGLGRRKAVGDNERTGCPRNPWHPPLPRAPSHLLFSTPFSILTSHLLCPDPHPDLPRLFRSCPWHPIVLFISSTHMHVHLSPSLTSSFQSILIQAAWGG